MDIFPATAPLRLRDIPRLFIRSVQQWSLHRASSKGAALALYTIFSLAPMLILVIAVAGVFFGEEAVQAELVGQLRDLMGQRGAEVIQIVLASAHESGASGLAALISIGVLLFSATTAFNELKTSLDDLWEVPADASAGIKGMVRARLQAFGLILVLAFFLLVSLSVNAGLAAARRYYGEIWNHSTFAWVAELFSNLFSFAVVTALFAAVYKLLPSIRLPWREVIPGAVITALLFIVGKWGIGLYLSRDAVASAYGAAGSVIALLLWIFYSSQVFFFGAVLTHQYSSLRQARARDLGAPAAETAMADTQAHEPAAAPVPVHAATPVAVEPVVGPLPATAATTTVPEDEQIETPPKQAVLLDPARAPTVPPAPKQPS
ncbi:Inner membrane protein YihY, formerly thought to be RNase BN [plant metagenome]|uniref:Inner membrane protein YihY, formerly thought to be RNase BN n=1 Tax=plant metagenome TaxID=1297885 RepID=A0A484T428_9ZZZZ